MTDQLTLRVGGQIYGGWKAVSVRTGIEQIAGSFDLSITERWPNQPRDWAIPPGELCQIDIGGDAVIAGYVDAVSVSYDAASHEIKVTGRDRTGDLVDCSAQSTTFTGLKFIDIAQRLTAPFGIAVTDQTAAFGVRRVAAPLPKLAVQNGETVFKTLEKLARMEGVLLMSDGRGGLVITRAGLGGDYDTVLEFGQNILRASSEHNHSNLYSEITVKAQAAAAMDAQYSVIKAHAKGVARRAAGSVVGNSKITRFRPLILIAENQAEANRSQQRAEWEVGHREANARRVTITVQGWRESATGQLWRHNRRVRVKCPWMRLDEWWLIASVAYKLDSGGTTAELSLVHEKAFNLLREIPDPKQGALQKKFQVVEPVKKPAQATA